MGLIEKLPDSVANNGIDSRVKWLNQNKGQDYKGYKFIATDGNIQLVPNGKTIVTYGKGTCALAIGNAIAQNAIPWAKILKVKIVAKAVGGIQNYLGKSKQHINIKEILVNQGKWH